MCVTAMETIPTRPKYICGLVFLYLDGKDWESDSKEVEERDDMTGRIVGGEEQVSNLQRS